MSIRSKRIVCTGCDYETREFYAPMHLYYCLPDGSTAPASRRRGWCLDCDSYRNIECVSIRDMESTLMQLQDDLVELNATVDQLSRYWWRRLFQRPKLETAVSEQQEAEVAIYGLEAILPKLRARQSGPRCLCCGSERTEPVTFDSISGLTNDFRHCCGGQLREVGREEDAENIRFARGVSTRWLDTEGRIVGTGKQPPRY